MSEIDATLPAAPLPASFARLRFVALAVGVIGLVLCAAGIAFGTLDQFFRAYLFAFLFWIAFPLGALGWVGIIHLTGGGWGRVILRIAESAALCLPLFAILFIPILFGVRHLFPWAQPELVKADAVLQHKSRYLNVGFFIARAVIYFVLWSFLAMRLARGSREYDRTQRDETAASNRAFSSFTVVFLIASVTLASVDWIMSREAHWYSTVLGFIVVVGQALSSLLLIVLTVTALVRYSPLKEFVTPGHFNDLGNLMLTCVILWAYLSFAQLLVSWTGNVQSDVKWYYPRMIGPYRWLGVALIVFHFFVPFFLLLMRDIKRKAARLAKVAVFLLVIRVVDAYWLVAPTGGGGGGFSRAWMDFWAPVGLGGLFLAVYLWQLGRRPLLSLPEINRSLGERLAEENSSSMHHDQGHAPHPA